MPLYTYECGNCGVRFDHQHSFKDRNLIRCPECNKHALHRVYRPVGVVFKGSGFYVTDNRSASSSSTTSTTTETKAESKPKEKSSETSPKSKSSND